MKRLALLLCSIIAVALVASWFQNSFNLSQGFKYTGVSCVKIIRKNGVIEDLGCDHNVLYNSGKDLIEELLGNTGSGGPVKNITLCNATAGCGTPVADASETWNEITTCGLESAQGTYSSIGVGNWSIQHTFTSTCDNVETNVTRIRNSAGTNLAGRSFTLATLQNGDQLQITWYIWVQ